MDRAAALRALSFTPFEGVADALGNGLGDASEDVKAAAAIGIARVRPELSTSSLRDLALHGTQAHKMEAVAALGRINIPSAREALRAVSVLDPSPEVRRRARAHLSTSSPVPA